MANEMAKTNGLGNALSADLAKSLLAGIADSRALTPITGGKPILRLLKDGKWCFGQNDEQVQEGSEWMISPLSIMHGYVCWSDYPGNAKNERLGEILAPITDKKPVMPGPVNGFPFKELRVLDLRCVSGDDEDVEVVYMASSIGGMRAVDGFLAALVRQIQSDPAHPVGIVQLNVDSYPHPKYGKTYTPVLEIVGWADMAGNRYDATPEESQGASGGEGPAEATAAPAKPVKAPLTQRAGATPRRQRPAEQA